MNLSSCPAKRSIELPMLGVSDTERMSQLIVELEVQLPVALSPEANEARHLVERVWQINYQLRKENVRLGTRAWQLANGITTPWPGTCLTFFLEMIQ